MLLLLINKKPDSIMQKYILYLFLIISFIDINAQQPENIYNLINEYKNSTTLQNGQWGLYAEYTDSSQSIISLNCDEALAPASCLKLVTTSAALYYLGEDFRYETKLYYDGKISELGTLNGNLYIVGSGDPTLGSSSVTGSLSLDDLMKTWIDAISKKGIKTIHGSVIADDLLFESITVPDNWYWVDIGNYYGAGTSALSINNNLYYLYFKPAKKVGGEAQVLRTEPEIPRLHFINYMKTGNYGSGDNGDIYCAPGQFTATLRGTIPAGVKEFSIKGSIPDPPLFAAQYLTKCLDENKIYVSKSASKIKSPVRYEDSKQIISTFSPKLTDIIYYINKRSDNFYTEQLLKTIALNQTGIGSFNKGFETLKAFLVSNDIPSSGINFFDGSGLSRSDAITTRTIARLLTFNTKQKYFDSFYNSLGVAGDKNDDGFFNNYGIDTPVAGNARLKDGYIGGVRSHSGYIKTKSARLISFSFIANNFNGSSKDVNKIHLRLMIELANLP
jgi:D-alanyl-D-alanine carboxypeptidase/D-alanyl-D-alanine-endopeptidase (penicillin-binding protein 4)